MRKLQCQVRQKELELPTFSSVGPWYEEIGGAFGDYSHAGDTTFFI
jgi:hypothetical protein